MRNALFCFVLSIALVCGCAWMLTPVCDDGTTKCTNDEVIGPMPPQDYEHAKQPFFWLKNDAAFDGDVLGDGARDR